VNDTESEGFWSEFLASLKERGLTGVKLLISDAHEGLTKAIRRQLQGCVRKHCRVHFARNLLQRVPKAHHRMVAAALRSVFAHPGAGGSAGPAQRSGLRAATRRPQVIDAVNPGRHGSIPLATHPRSDERLDKSIVTIHRG
jgi:putative transposase